GMQLGESTTEFKVLIRYRQRTESPDAGCFYLVGHHVVIDAEKPSDSCPLELEKTGCPVVGMKVNLALFDGPKNPHQHIVDRKSVVKGTSAARGSRRIHR